jgi:hypothetical protein
LPWNRKGNITIWNVYGRKRSYTEFVTVDLGKQFTSWTIINRTNKIYDSSFIECTEK